MSKLSLKGGETKKQIRDLFVKRAASYCEMKMDKDLKLIKYLHDNSEKFVV